METALRKAKSDLTLSGIGACAFGIWYFVKTILYNLFAKDYINGMLSLAGGDALTKPVIVFLWLLLSFFTMLLHLYVGLCAVSEGAGKDKRRRWVYLILAGVLLLGNGDSLVSSLRGFASLGGSLLEQICDILMEAARMANLTALLLAARRARTLTRKTETEALPHAN